MDGAGRGNPVSRGDAEGAENVPLGSDPGRGFMSYRTDPFFPLLNKPRDENHGKDGRDMATVGPVRNK